MTGQFPPRWRRWPVGVTGHRPRPLADLAPARTRGGNGGLVAGAVGQREGGQRGERLRHVRQGDVGVPVHRKCDSGVAGEHLRDLGRHPGAGEPRDERDLPPLNRSGRRVSLWRTGPREGARDGRHEQAVHGGKDRGQAPGGRGGAEQGPDDLRWWPRSRGSPTRRTIGGGGSTGA